MSNSKKANFKIDQEQVQAPTNIPLACETEKREKINQFKKLFMEKFIKCHSSKYDELRIFD
jgi:hypothetical protein